MELFPHTDQQHDRLLSVSWVVFLSYCFQRVSLAGLPTRLMFLCCIILANVTVGAALYRLASGKTWGSALFKTYGVLFRAPGIGVTAEETVAAALVLNIIFIFGLFVFAAFLGMISDEIKKQIHAMRVGDVRLPLSGHVLVLNWNQQSVSLLKQLLHAQADPRSRLFKRPIVVLSEQSKATMDAAVATAAAKCSNAQVYCRSGRPTKMPDLQRVAAEAADTVLVLHPEPSTSRTAADALKATALISLTCLRERAFSSGKYQYSIPLLLMSCLTSLVALKRTCRAMAAGSRAMAASSSSKGDSTHIVVQAPNGQLQHEGDQDVISFLQTTTASSSSNHNIQQVRLMSQNMLDRLVCQTALEPGVASVFRELVRAGADVQLKWCEVDDSLVGTYGQAALLFPATALLGVLAATSQELQLNPPDHLLLLPGDRLVGLTRLGAMVPFFKVAKQIESRQYQRTISRASSMASPGPLGTSSSSEASCNGTSSTSSTASRPTAAAAGGTKEPSASQHRGMRVVVLGWQEAAVPDLLQKLQGLAPKGSSITVVLPAEQGARLDAASMPTSGCTCSCLTHGKQVPKHAQQLQIPVQASNSTTAAAAAESMTELDWRQVRVSEPCSSKALLEAGILDADAVIIGSALVPAAPAASSEPDALVTATLLAIQQLLQGRCAANSCSDIAAEPAYERQQQPIMHASKAGGSSIHSSMRHVSRLHVVAVVNSYSVRRALQTFLSRVIIKCNFSYEVMVMDEFAAGMLVLVAQDASNSLVIDQLLVQPAASGMSMWSLQQLGLKASTSMCFVDVRRAARQRQSTALGYRRSDGRMVLVPASSVVVSFNAGDRVVVLAGTRSSSVTEDH